MKRAKIFAVVIYGMLVMATMTFVHFPELQADEAREHVARATITAEQAREAALRAVPGTVKDSELEREHGQLIYSFEIKLAGKRDSSQTESLGKRGIVEVNVNAMDGSIVNIHREHGHAGRRDEARQRAQVNAEPASVEDLL